jgi:hypothetical protein
MQEHWLSMQQIMPSSLYELTNTGNDMRLSGPRFAGSHSHLSDLDPAVWIAAQCHRRHRLRSSTERPAPAGCWQGGSGCCHHAVGDDGAPASATASLVDNHGVRSRC